jgi:D-serine deaminase-like pyridoxal phosphate-dependent protein
MTHGGHSYHGKTADGLLAIAERERVAAVSAAEVLRAAGHTIDMVSAGSTPTVTHFGKVDGLTELRAGVYVFQDLDQLGIGSCPDAANIALTVLATVIGHTTSGRVLIDAGGLALSKDLSAAKHGPALAAGYGWVAGHDDLHVAAVSQEHGQIDFKRKSSAQSMEDVALSKVFPVGSRVRIIPNHACFTAAAYDGYVAVDSDANSIDVWPRVNGWFDGAAVGNPERLRLIVGPSRL